MISCSQESLDLTDVVHDLEPVSHNGGQGHEQEERQGSAAEEILRGLRRVANASESSCGTVQEEDPSVVKEEVSSNQAAGRHRKAWQRYGSAPGG